MVFRSNFRLWGTFNDRGIQDPRAALHRVEAATLETGGRRISATVTLSSDAPLPYLAVLAAGRDPPTGVVPALATASFQVGHLASGKGDVHLTATRPIPAPAGGIVTDLAARHASSGGPDSGPRRLVAFWIDGGSWYLYRSVAALGRIPVLSSLERSGAVAAMASIPHTQEVLDEITGTGVRVPTLYSMSVQAVGQVRLAVGDVGPLRAFDPARFQALDSPEIRSLRDRLASAGRSSLFVLFNDMEVNSGDDLSFLDREGRPVKVDAGDLLARPLDVDGMIRALRAETGPEASEPTLAFAATEIARLQRRLDVMSILIDRYQPDLTLFRIDETDLLAHRLWNTLETLDPGLPSGPPDPHRRLLEVAYERLDAATGALLASLDPGTNVIVFSDHGILDQVRHDPVAMFLAVGPSFERSIVLRDLRVEHLRPLFLKLQGAPLDRGMVLPVGLLRESPRLGAVR